MSVSYPLRMRLIHFPYEIFLIWTSFCPTFIYYFDKTLNAVVNSSCVRQIFEYGSLSTITASDNIIIKIQRLQNKFIRLALRLPKYIIPRLLHDSTGLPYVKDRLLTCATKSLDRIAQNPLVEASISSHRHNPGWDRFSTPLSVVRPGDS